MPSKLVRASFWAMAGGGAQYVTVFLLLIYLAHVLEPRDFGLMATIAVGLDVGLLVARWGQVELLQQPRYQTRDARDQSLRLSLAIAVLFAALFAAAAGPLGQHLHSPRLTTIMYLCAPVFVFSAVGSIAEAILRSEFRFRLLAFRNTVVTLVGAAVAIVLALRGYGALALAAQRLAQAVLAGIWVWTAIDWRPRLWGRTPWSHALAREGANMMVGSVLPLVVPRTVDLLVGLLLGPTPLGLLRIAYRIHDFVAQMVVTPLVGIANAQFSSLNGDLEGLRRSYLRLTQVSAALICPMMIGLALVAPEAIPLIFGDKWRACVPLVQIISLLALVTPVNYYFPAAMVAVGHSRLVLRQGVFQLIVGVALAAAAAQISLQAVVIAGVVRATLVFVFNVYDIHRRLSLSLLDLWRHMAPPYLSTFAMTGAVLAARGLVDGRLSGTPMLLLLTAVGAAAYGAFLWLGGRMALWPAHAALFRRLAGLRRAAGDGAE